SITTWTPRFVAACRRLCGKVARRQAPLCSGCPPMTPPGYGEIQLAGITHEQDASAAGPVQPVAPRCADESGLIRPFQKNVSHPGIHVNTAHSLKTVPRRAPPSI
ncbi:unnamed protein product, partial [Effrenium voratum]